MGRELPQGRRVGNYGIERLLGKDGLSAVYAARQARTDRLCTLTVFQVDPDEEPWSRFRRELEQLAALRHPNLLEILDLGVAHDGTPYLVTESVPGEDLATRLRRSGALTLPEALAVARQAGVALHAAHGIGVLHRGVRPDRLLLIPQDRPPADDEPGFERIKLTGFGVAGLLESTVKGLALVGDPDYLAPEQVLGQSLDVDLRTDQYALAVVLYQALTTSRPFHGDSVGATLVQVTRNVMEPLRALRPDIPSHVDATLARALAKDREARFPDMAALLDALQEGVPLPLGMQELTGPWLEPPPDLEAARQRVLAAGAVPVAPLSLGVSAALELAQRRQIEADAVPQVIGDSATVPVSMEAVMQLAVPAEPAPSTRQPAPSGERELLQAPEIIEEFTEDGRPVPRKGETEVTSQVIISEREGAGKLPSIIVDLPTRPTDGEHLPRGVAAPHDPTRLSPHAGAAAGSLARGLTEHTPQMGTTGPAPRLFDQGRAGLGERLAWAAGGLGVGWLLTHFMGC